MTTAESREPLPDGVEFSPAPAASPLTSPSLSSSCAASSPPPSAVHLEGSQTLCTPDFASLLSSARYVGVEVFPLMRACAAHSKARDGEMARGCSVGQAKRRCPAVHGVNAWFLLRLHAVLSLIASKLSSDPVAVDSGSTAPLFASAGAGTVLEHAYTSTLQVPLLRKEGCAAAAYGRERGRGWACGGTPCGSYSAVDAGAGSKVTVGVDAGAGSATTVAAASCSVVSGTLQPCTAPNSAGVSSCSLHKAFQRSSSSGSEQPSLWCGLQFL